MSITYEEWCNNNTNIVSLVRSLKSSIPEQYIGFYLHKVFGDEVEYQKQFDWLGRYSLDIFIPSLQLGIEYDGSYYHRNKGADDSKKTSLCFAHGINLIRIHELKAIQEKCLNKNVVNYYYDKNYENIDIAIQSLCVLINEHYGTTIQINVDINRDNTQIISYVQSKYYKKTIAYKWPEAKRYWLEEKNQQSIYDVFYTDNNSYELQCPYCQKRFFLRTRYFHDRKSFIPCECEYGKIEHELNDAVRKYIETGELVVFDNSLSSRRLYDRMEQSIRYGLNLTSKEEIEMYKKLGFESHFYDFYLKRIDEKNNLQ